MCFYCIGDSVLSNYQRETDKLMSGHEKNVFYAAIKDDPWFAGKTYHESRLLSGKGLVEYTAALESASGSWASARVLVLWNANEITDMDKHAHVVRHTLLAEAAALAETLHKFGSVGDRSGSSGKLHGIVRQR